MTANAVAEFETTALPGTEGRRAVTPFDMLNTAVTNGASVEVMEKLMGLHERWQAGQARKAFDAAISEAKAEIQPVIKNATGHNNKRYADFAAIARAVDPIISRHGLSYRFRTLQTERINVTCILSHRDGHSEETTLAGPADTTGSKNAIQAIGSTLTYLQRYTLVQALGLAASEDDNGASAGAGDSINDEQFTELDALMNAVNADLAKFCLHFKIDALPDLPAARFKEAKTMLEAKRAGK